MRHFSEFKKFFWIPLLAEFICALPSSGAVHSKTLNDCFELALRRSEIIATQSELIFQAENRYKQAIGSILPNLSATGSQLVQESTSNSIFPTTQPLIKLTATQPLFQGFKEFAGIKQTKDQIESQDQAKQLATIQLYQDTAQSFYTLLSLDQELEHISEQIQLYEKRIQELNQFVKIGRSRRSEVLTVQTQKENLLAQQELTQQQRNVAFEVLHFLTGLDSKTTFSDNEPIPPKFPSLSSYLSEMNHRPDIKSAQANVSAAEQGIRIAESGHYPSVNLLGNYYFLRAGLLQSVHWDTQITLTFPIFSGGIVQSGVRIAESQKATSDLALSRTQRLAEQEISTLHHNLEGDQRQVEAYTRTKKLAETNYASQVQDYKHGLVNNIDVLLALTAYKESERALDRSVFNVKLDYAKLEAAVTHRPKLEQK